MRTIAISRFKATCLSLLEWVRRTGQPILVTKRGVPVAQVVPPPPAEPPEGSAFGCLGDEITELGDIVEPLGDEEWEAAR